MKKDAFRLLLAAALAALIPAFAAGQERVIHLLSQTSRGQSAEGRSEGPAVNGNGTAAAYNSNALNLVSPPFQNFRGQIYVRELDQVTSQLVSTSPTGQAGNQSSQSGGFGPGFSADGRFVAFSSRATNLVPDDANAFEDVFVYDRDSGAMQLVSRGQDGAPSNGASTFPRLSGDGRYVVFQSNATNIVSGDDNRTSDIFLFDRESETMRRVSVASDGSQSNGASITPTISQDGRMVAFASRATNFVTPAPSGAFEQIYAHDVPTGATALVSLSDDGQPANAISFLPVLTADGEQVAFKSEAFNLVPNDTNGVPDVFVRDRIENTTQRVSVDSFGNQGNGLSGGPGISADGRYVAFVSFASNFVPDDGNGFSDVYVYDRFPPGRDQGRIERVTVALDNFGEPNEGVADFPVSVSADGRWIAFASAASNLVPNDVNNDLDAFLACNPFDEFDCAPPTPTPGTFPCVGDCNGDGQVTIDDLIRMVNIALGFRNVCGGDDGMGECLAGDADCDCQITIDEIVQAVNNNLLGCMTFGTCTLPAHEAMCCEGPGGTPTPTPTSDDPNATPTPTADGPVPTFTPTPPATATATPTQGPVGPCVGDCSGDGDVTIDELIRMVNIALGTQTLCAGDGSLGCLAGDAGCDCAITVDDIVTAVNNNLNGCTTFGDCPLGEHEAQCCLLDQ